MEPVLLLGFKDKSRLLNHIRESRIAVRTTRTERMYLRGSLSVVSCPPRSGSLVDDLDLLVEHLAGEAIDRHMHPIMLFPFYDKITLKVARIGLEMT